MWVHNQKKSKEIIDNTYLGFVAPGIVLTGQRLDFVGKGYMISIGYQSPLSDLPFNELISYDFNRKILDATKLDGATLHPTNNGHVRIADMLTLTFYDAGLITLKKEHLEFGGLVEKLVTIAKSSNDVAKNREDFLRQLEQIERQA